MGLAILGFSSVAGKAGSSTDVPILSYTDNHVNLGILSLFLQVRRWNLRGAKKIAQMGETELFTAPFCLSKRGCAIQTPFPYLK